MRHDRIWRPQRPSWWYCLNFMLQCRKPRSREMGRSSLDYLLWLAFIFNLIPLRMIWEETPSEVLPVYRNHLVRCAEQNEGDTYSPIALPVVESPAHCGWHHSLGWDPALCGWCYSLDWDPGLYKKEKRSQALTCTHHSLLPGCGCDVTSCLKLLLPWLSYCDGLHIWAVSQNKPSLPFKFFLSGHN